MSTVQWVGGRRPSTKLCHRDGHTYSRKSLEK